MTEVTDGLNEGDEIVVDLASAPAEQVKNNAEQSPFMPTPPGGNKKKSK